MLQARDFRHVGGQRFANAEAWARENGLNGRRVRDSLRNGDLPGAKIGKRWMIDVRSVEQMLVPRRPA